MAQGQVDTLLKEYRSKRDFSRTEEPDHTARRAKGKQAPLAFVVHKHDATRLHYDFRLEWEGVLKSWAVTRGPSYDPSEKRLAVRTEDHPLAYGDFEGTIPEDQYGGGTVMLWDRGNWESVGDFEEGLKSGKLVFRLNGERLKGEWTLVRMRGKPKEKRENWLLIKHHEDDEKPPRGDVLKKYTKSVASERTMAAIASAGRLLSKADLSKSKQPQALRKAAEGKAEKKPPEPKKTKAAPKWREPQLATLVGDAPDGDDWLSEMKYDGYRVLISVGRGGARVYTRNGKDWTDKFPQIAEAAAALDTDGALIDGEAVAFDRNGKTDFSTLQSALSNGGDISCFVFDLIVDDGASIADKPLVERKERLQKLIGGTTGPLIYSDHVHGSAAHVLERLCDSGHEGIIAKRGDSRYRSGRGRTWLKVKCTRRQEFVIGGYSRTDKKGRPFSSVLVGVMEDDKLVYKGRVGSFQGDTLDMLAPKLKSRERKTSPFGELPASVKRDAVFVRPDLVAEIEFAEFTADGHVRHGVFKGLREDKEAGDVVMESPGGSGESKAHEERNVIAGVKLTHPDRVMFDEQGVTKADLAAHYERVAERMLPHVQGRLLSLVRCPDGRNGQCFYQKHESRGFPSEIKRMEIAESDGKRDNYLYVDDVAGIVAAVQMGTLEFHIWGSRADRLENRDRLVFDLDPDEGLTFADVREAAFDLQDRLEALGLKTVPLLTGGKGIHVIAPLERRREWADVKAFARGFSEAIAADEPERYVSQASKAKRKGRIFIDWLRNERGATAVAPYSTRARKGGPVATPVSWQELRKVEAANVFSIEDMAERLKARDPWADAEKWRQSVTAEMLRKVGAAKD